jgi:hypothetical protein
MEKWVDRKKTAGGFSLLRERLMLEGLRRGSPRE